MFPIRDDAPCSTTPYVNYTLIALNVAAFIFELGISGSRQYQLIHQFGLEPVNVAALFHGSHEFTVAAAFLPFLTSMFLHASWVHLGGNMLALYIFGDNIEDRIGPFKYLLLYLFSGVLAASFHVALNLDSSVPTVGASGAIAGVMGAYFLLFPTARVLTVLPIGIFMVWLPAWVVLGYWFVAQFLSGAATSISHDPNIGGVAFWAHVGGFIAGATLIKLIPARAPRYSFMDQ